MGCTALHPRDQPPDQGPITLRADLATQPQARADHQGQGHPDDAALLLDTDFVRLYLPQVAGMLDEMLLHRLALAPSTRQPARHRAFVRAKRDNDRWQWASVGEQRHHQAHSLRRGP
jgi:hypothetical protein